MNSIFIICTCVVSIAMASQVRAAPSSFDPIFKSLTGGEVERDSSRAKLLSMPKAELSPLLTEAKARALTSRRMEVVRAFDIIRRRPDFDAAQAAEMKMILKSDAKLDLLEERLGIFLDAKAGSLSVERIQAEFLFIANATEASARRLARLTALTDSMQQQGLRPTTTQLSTLLQNDVFEIRMHAVDWFRLSPPDDLKEKGEFLKKALASNVVQVRERAFRTIASWSPSNVQALKRIDVLPAKCAADPSSVIRRACADIREKEKQP